MALLRRFDGNGAAGVGFTFRIIPDTTVNYENIQARIAAKEFDLIVYGSIENKGGAMFWKDVKAAG